MEIFLKKDLKSFHIFINFLNNYLDVAYVARSHFSLSVLPPPSASSLSRVPKGKIAAPRRCAIIENPRNIKNALRTTLAP
jgi:hypothetical protein